MAGALSELSTAIPNQKKGKGETKLKSPFLPAPDLPHRVTANSENRLRYYTIHPRAARKRSRSRTRKLKNGFNH